MYLITSAVGGTLGLIFLIVWALLSIYSIINVIRTSKLNLASKILWAFIIIVVPILGSLVYLFWRKVKEL